MRPKLHLFAAVVAALLLAFTVAACGGDDESSSGGSSSGGTSSESTPDSGGESAGGNVIEKDPANADKGTITVGSKNFDEQFVLGEIYAQGLAAAGFDTKTELNLGSEQVAFKALKQGEIDAYPEYIGTALTSFYKVKTEDVPRDLDTAFSDLEEDLAKDDITPMPLTPFENTYKIASTKETAEKLGNPKTLTELAKAAGKKYSLSAFPECRQRTDCLLGLQQTYGWYPKFISSQGQYADLDSGEADFTTGFSTDGPLSTGKYVVYEDDKGLYPPYQVSLLVRNDAVDKLGEAGRAVIEQIQEPLTDKVMAELNSRVSIDKEKPADVAAQYLKEAGFVQ
jgi:glycine betaine/choline ABC-type transport system substrate-binding protein